MKKRNFWGKLPFTFAHLLVPLLSIFFILGDVDPPGSHYDSADIQMAIKIMWLPFLILMTLNIRSKKSYWNWIGFIPTLSFVVFDSLVLGSHWFDSVMMFGVLHLCSLIFAQFLTFLALPRRYAKKQVRSFIDLFMTHSIAGVPGAFSLFLIGRHLWEVEYSPFIFLIVVLVIVFEAMIFLKDFDKLTELDKVRV